jgi:hypothetical protein
MYYLEAEYSISLPCSLFGWRGSFGISRKASLQLFKVTLHTDIFKEDLSINPPSIIVAE